MGISAEGRAHEQKLTIFNAVLYSFNKWEFIIVFLNIFQYFIIFKYSSF